MNVIKVSAPSIGIDEQQAVTKVLMSGWIGQGDKVLAFEEQCRLVIGCRYFIAVASCTKAIEIAFLLSGFSAGDEVILPALTYASVVQVIVKLGMIPVFVEVDISNLNIAAEAVGKKIGPKTRFVLPLHFRGHACDIAPLKELVKDRNIHIVEDAAHAFGSAREGIMAGSDSYAACFSFGPLKNICCIEGGGIATNDKELAEKIIAYRNLGMASSTWQRYNTANSYPWEYEVIGGGDKCQMNDVGAAMGLVQLGRLEEIKAKKRSIVDRYVSGLSGNPLINIPELCGGDDFLYIFTVLMEQGKRDAVMKYLLDKGISTAVHYYPAHLQSYFRQYARQPLPVTEDIGGRIVTLPSYTDLTERDQVYVIDAVNKFSAF